MNMQMKKETDVGPVTFQRDDQVHDFRMFEICTLAFFLDLRQRRPDYTSFIAYVSKKKSQRRFITLKLVKDL